MRVALPASLSARSFSFRVNSECFSPDARPFHLTEGSFYFTSTEARWLIRDGGRGGGRKSEGSTADTARKRPERPWTAARAMEVLRRCPLAIASLLMISSGLT